MTYDPSIDPDDRLPPQKPGESPLEYMRRIANAIHVTKHNGRDCRCAELGWVEQHEASSEERIDTIFRKAKA